MKIGELAKQTGMAASAIRFLRTESLLSKVRRGPTAIATTRARRCSADHHQPGAAGRVFPGRDQTAGYQRMSPPGSMPAAGSAQIRSSDIEALEARLRQNNNCCSPDPWWNPKPGRDAVRGERRPGVSQHGHSCPERNSC